MTQNFKTSTEDKIVWLQEHRDLWDGKDLTYFSEVGHVNYMRLFRAMRDAGLYSDRTGAHDAYLAKLVTKVPVNQRVTNKERHNGK